MVNCSDWEELNTKYRTATLRYSRFVDSLKGRDPTDRDEEEATRLGDDEMNEAQRALSRHQAKHGCRVDPDPKPNCHAVTDCSFNSTAHSGSSFRTRLTLVFTGYRFINFASNGCSSSFRSSVPLNPGSSHRS